MIPAHLLAELTAPQLAALKADPALYDAFEAGIAKFAPKTSGVCWSGMQGETWVPVQACFDNAERAVRFARRGQKAAA